MDTAPIDPRQAMQAAAMMADLTKRGSPVLLRSVGRLCGLGQAEQNELAANGLPKWTVAVAGIGVGFALGAWARAAHPTFFNTAQKGARS